MTGAIVRYACDTCQRFWATEDELRNHACGEGDAIVRELAERGPFHDPLWFSFEQHARCGDCKIVVRHADINNPANHELSCLWRRARELYAPKRAPRCSCGTSEAIARGEIGWVRNDFFCEVHDA